MIRVLLVEDNEMNRDMLSRRLKRKGFLVSIAVNGEKAVAAAIADIPDIVLMDISLPVMDGYEASRLIKKHEKTRNVPILGLSAHAMDGDAERARSAGCDDYDVKPIEFRRLLKKMEKLLSDYASRRVETAQQSPVLVVDLNEAPSKDLARHLKRSGTEVRMTTDSEKALAFLERRRASVVVVDLKQPTAPSRSLLVELLRLLEDDSRLLVLTTLGGQRVFARDDALAGLACLIEATVADVALRVGVLRAAG